MLRLTHDFFNPTGIVKAGDASVEERYAYSAFGIRGIMARDFWDRTQAILNGTSRFKGSSKLIPMALPLASVYRPFGAWACALKSVPFESCDKNYKRNRSEIRAEQIKIESRTSTSSTAPSPRARRSFSPQWFDGVGRGLAEASFGTNGGAMIIRPARCHPERDETVLVRALNAWRSFE